jgi:hypothetical protein
LRIRDVVRHVFSGHGLTVAASCRSRDEPVEDSTGNDLGIPRNRIRR